MLSSISLGSAIFDATTVCRIDATYSHPYRVRLEFETSSNEHTSDRETAGEIAAFSLPFEDFARYAEWIAHWANRLSTEGFLNRRVWPANLAKHAIAAGRPIPDPVEIRLVDGAIACVSVAAIDGPDRGFSLSVSLKPDARGDAGRRPPIIDVRMTEAELSELAVHLAIKRHAHDFKT